MGLSAKKSLFSHLLNLVWPLVIPLTSLGLTFLICNVETLTMSWEMSCVLDTPYRMSSTQLVLQHDASSQSSSCKLSPLNPGFTKLRPTFLTYTLEC